MTGEPPKATDDPSSNHAEASGGGAALAAAVRQFSCLAAAKLLFSGESPNIDADGYPLTANRPQISLLELCYGARGLPPDARTTGSLLLACGADPRPRQQKDGNGSRHDMIRDLARAGALPALTALCANGVSPLPYFRAIVSGEESLPPLPVLLAMISGVSQCIVMLDSLTEACAGEVIYVGLSLPDLLRVLKDLRAHPGCDGLNDAITTLLEQAAPCLCSDESRLTLIVRSILALFSDRNFTAIRHLLQSDFLSERQIFAILCNLPSPPLLTVLCGWIRLFEGDALAMLGRDLLLRQIWLRFLSAPDATPPRTP